MSFLRPACAGFFIPPPRQNNVASTLKKQSEDFAKAVLTEKTAVDAWFQSHPGSKASRKTAKEKASRLLKSPAVAKRIAELRQQAAGPAIMSLKEILNFWSLTTQNGKEDIFARIAASKALAQHYYKLQAAQQNAAQPAHEPPQNAEDFAQFCERHAYPRPYPKQVEMAEFVQGSGPRLVLGSRGYGKTDYGVICAPAWQILHDPQDTYLILTKEKERGTEIISEIARILTEEGVALEKSSSKRLVLAGHTGKDPNVAVLPLRSKSFRGRHPKHIICDDLITPDDVSKAERDKVEAVRAELMKLTENVCFIGQPAHAKDVYAKLRRLPGVKKMEVPYGSIPQLDVDLQAQRAAGISEESIQASYFLQISEAERIPFAGVEIVNFFPAGSCVGFVDPSHEGADYTAMAIGAMNFDNFVVAGFAWPKAWDDCAEDIGRVCMAYNVAKFAFETNGVGKHPVVMFRRNGANVAEWRSDTNKHGRILNAASFKGHLKLASYLPPALLTPAFRQAQQTFNNMVLEYEYKAEHDDAPDALANLMMYLGLVKK